MLSVNKIKNMTMDEVLDMIDDSNIVWVVSNYQSDANFVQKYKEGAKLSGEDKYFTPNEYIEKIKERNLFALDAGNEHIK